MSAAVLQWVMCLTLSYSECVAQEGVDNPICVQPSVVVRGVHLERWAGLRILLGGLQEAGSARDHAKLVLHLSQVFPPVIVLVGEEVRAGSSIRAGSHTAAVAGEGKTEVVWEDTQDAGYSCSANTCGWLGSSSEHNGREDRLVHEGKICAVWVLQGAVDWMRATETCSAVAETVG
ncbi:hypothetical protein B0H14DRAFT_2588796 [Mycena olivaceomarginata]|nr:hypothetical protein B0H14DRAFT_2588796 [Mycena olivaceomarginata]